MTEKIKREADELLGDEEKELLRELLVVFKDKSVEKDTHVRIEELRETIDAGNTSLEIVLKELRELISAQKLEVPELQKVLVQNQPQPVEEVVVKNLADIHIPKAEKFPTEIDTKEPAWFPQYVKAIVDAVRKPSVVKIDGSRDPKSPIAVRLSDGKKFIETIGAVVGGVARAAFPFEDSSGKPKAPIVDSNGRLTVDATVSITEVTDFEGGPVTVGTTAVELTFAGTTDSIQIQSDHDNAGTIWYGKSNIDNTGANTFGRLEAGEAVQFDLNDASAAVYAVSDTAAQTVFKMALI